MSDVRVTVGIIDPYAGHICVTREPGCTCADHADALRERDRLRLRTAHLEAAIRSALEDHDRRDEVGMVETLRRAMAGTPGTRP